MNGLAQDTPQFTYALAGSWVPTTFYTETTDSAITVVSTATLAWADVHYAVNGGTQQNVRLTQQGSSYVQPVTLQPGDVLAEYSVTYSAGAAVFDTALAQYTAGSGGARFVVDVGTDGAAGVCVANGDSAGRCNLRAALLAARGWTGAVTVDLSVDSTVDAGQIEVGAGPSAIVIESAPGGASHSITGAGTSRLFQVDSGVTLTLGPALDHELHRGGFGRSRHRERRRPRPRRGDAHGECYDLLGDGRHDRLCHVQRGSDCQLWGSSRSAVGPRSRTTT